MALTHTKF